MYQQGETNVSLDDLNIILKSFCLKTNKYEKFLYFLLKFLSLFNFFLRWNRKNRMWNVYKIVNKQEQQEE